MSPSHCRLFIHCLSPHADGAALKEAFSHFGAITNFHTLADRRASGSGSACSYKGYGFVSFTSRVAVHRVRPVRFGCPPTRLAEMEARCASRSSQQKGIGVSEREDGKSH